MCSNVSCIRSLFKVFLFAFFLHDVETFSAYILKSYLLLQKAGSLFKWIQLFYAINGWLLEYN